MKQQVAFRPITANDQDFLCRLYASTRQDEMAVVPWSEAEKEAFLNFQFTAQHKYYQEHFTQAAFDLILLNTEPIGRLYLDHRTEEFHIIDIALLPQYRGQGLGSKLMANILTEAETVGLPVRIHVEKNNPALRLYRRLGFTEIGDDEGVYYLMEWQPGSDIE
ncbi:MAG: GNAT family N-acetyltransferase [bacterium]|nr:GNAT family N-acetyltransferase [bacterium]